MDVQTKIDLVLRYPTVECITVDELKELFETRSTLKHYIGFEISGKVHLGTGLMTATKIKQLKKAGVKTTIFMADYHAWINNKFNGDLELIQEVAKKYFEPAMKSLNLEDTEFILASNLYKDTGYWKHVLDITKNTTMNRMLRCTTIMGRTVSDLSNDCSYILYPAMQCADIIQLDVDIMHGGMDQRKVHMLYKDLREKLGERERVALHTKLLMGLQGPKRMGFEEDETLDAQISSKMSKSNPMSCIFIHDSEEEIANKIKSAYCPIKDIKNPVVEISELILNEYGELRVERPMKYGGDMTYTVFSELTNDYANGKLHPTDLKNAVTKYLIKLLEPARKFFQNKQDIINFVEKKQKE
ncbi:MAG: tyrosine--tRNA ligase [Candidatus Micrarchaeota archaeon]|nr:tyrosine--tRNA ligase [Candidatus Micrarchaeota archaeon]